MNNKKRNFIFDKIILKYQSLSEKEKMTLDIFIKVLAVLLLIVLIFKIGSILGEYLFNINVEI